MIGASATKRRPFGVAHEIHNRAFSMCWYSVLLRRAHKIFFILRQVKSIHFRSAPFTNSETGARVKWRSYDSRFHNI